MPGHDPARQPAHHPDDRRRQHARRDARPAAITARTSSDRSPTLWVTATPAESRTLRDPGATGHRAPLHQRPQPGPHIPLAGGVLELLAPGIDLSYQRALAVPLTLVVGHTWQLQSVKADSYYATDESAARDRARSDPRPSARPESSPEPPDAAVQHHLHRERRRDRHRQTAQPTQARPCDSDEEAIDTYVMSVVKSGFTFISGLGELGISSPRAEITLAFVN